MAVRFTIHDVQRLQQTGKIKGYTEPRKRESKPAPNVKKLSKSKTWMAEKLAEWCKGKGVELKTEYRFHPARKWRFDWAIPSLMIAVEYEGIFNGKSRHTTAGGFMGDMEKYNAATKMGWRVYRYAGNEKSYKNVINDLNDTK